MANDNLIPSYSFSVTLDEIPVSFSKVRNISGSVQYDAIVEGGNNDAPVLLKKPKSNPDTLILEKGVTTSTMDALLAVVKEGFMISNILINVNKNGKLVRSFYVTNGVITARQFSDLDASDSAVLIEALQITHTGLTEVPTIF